MGKTKQQAEKKFNRNVEISAPILDPEIIRAIHSPPKDQKIDVRHGGFKALLTDLNSQDSTDELTPITETHLPSYIGISCAVSGYSSYSSYGKRGPESAAERVARSQAGANSSSNSNNNNGSNNSNRVTSHKLAAPSSSKQPNRSHTSSPVAVRVEPPNVHHVTIDKSNIGSIEQERRELTEKLTASATERRRSPSPIPPTEDDRHHGAYVGARYFPMPEPSREVQRHIPLLGIDDEIDPDEAAAAQEDANKVEHKIASLYGDEFVEDWRESMSHKAKKEHAPEGAQNGADGGGGNLRSARNPKDLVTLKPTPPRQAERAPPVEVDVPTPNIKVLAGVEKQFLNRLLTDENPPMPKSPSPQPSSPISHKFVAPKPAERAPRGPEPVPSPPEPHKHELQHQQQQQLARDPSPPLSPPARSPTPPEQREVLDAPETPEALERDSRSPSPVASAAIAAEEAQRASEPDREPMQELSHERVSAPSSPLAQEHKHETGPELGQQESDAAPEPSYDSHEAPAPEPVDEPHDHHHHHHHHQAEDLMGGASPEGVAAVESREEVSQEEAEAVGADARQSQLDSEVERRSPTQSAGSAASRPDSPNSQASNSTVERAPVNVVEASEQQEQEQQGDETRGPAPESQDLLLDLGEPTLGARQLDDDNSSLLVTAREIITQDTENLVSFSPEPTAPETNNNIEPRAEKHAPVEAAMVRDQGAAGAEKYSPELACIEEDATSVGLAGATTGVDSGECAARGGAEQEPLPAAASKLDGNHFLSLLAAEESFIMEQVRRAEERLAAHEAEMDEDQLGRIHSAIGKANLLINKKCNQFKGLCEQSLSGGPGEQYAVLSDDLAGFWDMISIQIADVRKSFENL